MFLQALAPTAVGFEKIPAVSLPPAHCRWWRPCHRYLPTGCRIGRSSGMVSGWCRYFSFRCIGSCSCWLVLHSWRRSCRGILAGFRFRQLYSRFPRVPASDWSRVCPGLRLAVPASKAVADGSPAAAEASWSGAGQAEVGWTAS